MTKTNKPEMDDPDDLRRKLKLLEGDRNAYSESSKSQIEANRQQIVGLRRENKELGSHLRKLKNPPNRKHGAGVGHKQVALLDHKVSNLIKKHNEVRGEATSIEARIIQEEQAVIDIEKQKTFLLQHEAGESGDAVRVRDLRNDHDKAVIHCREAEAIGNTYEKIIKQLNKERLVFDNEVTDLEAQLRSRSEELVRLKKLSGDAMAAKEAAKQQLADAEKQASEARSARDAEKKKLNLQADEQRKKYEAMEMRLRQQAGAGTTTEATGDAADGTKNKIESYEEAMKRIQDATGVSDIQEVVQRYYAQEQSKVYLEEMRVKNTALLTQLREKKDNVTKQFEALKYSGEARNTSNQRMMKEFESHLTSAEGRRSDANGKLAETSAMLVRVKTGIDHLYDKLDNLKAVKHRAANTEENKLEESEHRLVELIKDLEQRKGDLSNEEIQAPLVVSEYNTRILMPSNDNKDDEDEEESDDEYAITREQIKKQAQDMVDSQNTTRTRKGRRR